MRPIRKIIIHCSDSTFGTADMIRQWHTEPPPRGRGWRDIGYHYVIENGHLAPKCPYEPGRDGLIERGRPVEEIGAHCENHNADSIGVCLVGLDRPGDGPDPAPLVNFTERQMNALYVYLANALKVYGLKVVDVIGHYETDTGKAQGKTCPNMDMNAVRAELARWMNGRTI